MNHPAEAPVNPDVSFRISSRRLDDGILVAPSGEIDLKTAVIVDDELRRAEQSESRIVLDLGEVSFMDSTGLRMVMSADHRLRTRGGSLRILNVGPQVTRLFELVGILDHLEIEGRAPSLAPLPGDGGSVSPN